MTENQEITLSSAGDASHTAKRRQIMDGARLVFLEQGFDAASMGEIARKAGVSKGTLYVYFKSKEDLFEAIFEEESAAQVERIFSLDPDDHNVEDVLITLGRGYAKYLCQPDRLSPLRTVLSIATRMPELGERFYIAGPLTGIRRVRTYLEAQITAGILEIEDPEVAAAQLLDTFQSTLFKPMMFSNAGPPADERIDHVVRIAVRTFLAAYRRS
jgi:AcrR family transcriptional regulator